MQHRKLAIVAAAVLYIAAIGCKEKSIRETVRSSERARAVPTVEAVPAQLSEADRAALARAEIAVEVREHAINRVMILEGGYADHKRDPGGPTKYGITQATATAHGFGSNVMGMSVPQAQDIYRMLWIESNAGDVENQILAEQYFDTYVNHGPKAVRWLRRVESLPYPTACLQLNRIREGVYRNSKNWRSFGKGWLTRVTQNRAECVA